MQTSLRYSDSSRVHRDETSIVAERKTGRSLSPQRTTKCTSSQNQFLLNELSRWFREPEFSYVGTNAAVLLQSVLKTHTYSCVVHVERRNLLFTSPIYHQFLPVLPHLSPSFSVFPRCLKCRLLYENFHLFKHFFFWNVCTRKLCSRFTATLSVGLVFSKYILRKHAMLQRYSHSDCRVAERLET